MPSVLATARASLVEKLFLDTFKFPPSHNIKAILKVNRKYVNLFYKQSG